MKKKLLMTTAISSIMCMAVTNSALSETKISGDIEQTFATVSKDLATDTDGKRGFGTETNISLSSSKDLDNGMTAKYGFTLEADSTAKADAKYLTLESGNFSVTFGEDVGNDIDISAIPYVDDYFETVGGSTGAGLAFTAIPSALTHESAHISGDYTYNGTTFTAMYAPSSSNKQGDSNVVDNGGSLSTLAINGSLGVEGLNVTLAKTTLEQANGADAGDDEDATKMGVSYSFGSVTAGIERFKNDSGSTDATAETTADLYGIAYGADNFSAGIYLLKNEREATTTEEEAKMIQLGYNLGGLGIALSYMQIEDASFVSGSDADVIQLHTTQKF